MNGGWNEDFEGFCFRALGWVGMQRLLTTQDWIDDELRRQNINIIHLLHLSTLMGFSREWRAITRRGGNALGVERNYFRIRLAEAFTIPTQRNNRNSNAETSCYGLSIESKEWFMNRRV